VNVSPIRAPRPITFWAWVITFWDFAGRSPDLDVPICFSSDHWPDRDLALLTQSRTSHSILRIQGGVKLRFPESP
jgi:hypothetical protein